MLTLQTLSAKADHFSDLMRRNIQVARLAIAVETNKPLKRGTGYVLLVVGVAVGVFISFLLQVLAVLVMIALGFALGYGARSYVSMRRRDRYRRERLMR